MLFASALIVAAAILWAARMLALELRERREGADRARMLHLLTVFAGAATAADDPKTLLAWQTFARTVRHALPADFSALERAAGAHFPFSRDQIQAAHARWTSDWLAWEHTHDAEYKLKAAEAEAQLAADGGSASGRARLDAVEREKLDRYQHRYAEYVRVAKALQALTDQAT